MTLSSTILVKGDKEMTTDPKLSKANFTECLSKVMEQVGDNEIVQLKIIEYRNNHYLAHVWANDPSGKFFEINVKT